VTGRFYTISNLPQLRGGLCLNGEYTVINGTRNLKSVLLENLYMIFKLGFYHCSKHSTSIDDSHIITYTMTDHNSYSDSSIEAGVEGTFFDVGIEDEVWVTPTCCSHGSVFHSHVPNDC